MPLSFKRGAAITTMVLALFLVGQSADAAFRDWFNFWPVSPLLGPKVETPAVGAQTPGGGAPMPSATTPMPGAPMPGETSTTGGQPQSGLSDHFFCNSLGREATKIECEQADRQKQEQQQPKQQCEPAQVFCSQINRCASPQECAQATPVCAPGQQPSSGQPCKFDERQQNDEEQMRKEKDEKFRMESEQSRKREEEKMRREQEMKKEDMMRKEEEMNKEREKNSPQDGMRCPQGEVPGMNDRGEKGCIRKDQGMMPPQQPPQSMEGDMGEGERPPVFVDQRWVKDTLRNIRDQRREINRILKQAKRLQGADALVTEIQGILAKFDEYEQKIKSAQGEELQETLQEFNDLQLWESVNALRVKIEMPKQLAQIEKELKRNEKLLKQKSFQRLKEFGVDLGKIAADFESIRSTVQTVKNLMNSGNFEDVQEAMQDIWEGGKHPGEIGGVLHQLKNMAEGLRRIRNQEIRADVQEVFQPVIDAINEGDYREANQLLNELWPEFNRILPKLYGLRRTIDDKLKAKLEQLGDRIQEKFQGGGENELMQPQPLPTP